MCYNAVTVGFPDRLKGEAMTRRQKQLAAIRVAEERLLSRLFRTVHALEKVRAQRKRIMKAVAAGVPDKAQAEPGLDDSIEDIMIRELPDANADVKAEVRRLIGY